MDELVNLIVQKTGIPAATAQTVVKMVIAFIKKKLPVPLGAQIDGILSNEAGVKMAGNMPGNLASRVGKKKK
ncbi:MAG: hypothetical protein NTV38_12675 [Chloroflexi bacterium]|nr:hypothetical protein [Chloroflexota bacterium]